MKKLSLTEFDGSDAKYDYGNSNVMYDEVNFW